MKIRHPLMIKALALAGAWLIRLWSATLRYRYQPLGPGVEPNRRDTRGRYIYAFWHEYILVPAAFYGCPRLYVLISRHADGQLMSEICRHLRFRVIEGSTTRGGVEAMRQMLRVGRRAHVAITPDGPRGPRRHVQSGLIYLAARTGLPIVPIGVGLDRPWRLRSWDHFALPRPWSLATCFTLPPITVPADADKEMLEQYRQEVEQALQKVTAVAEHWVERKRH